MKKLAKEYIFIAHGSRQQCGEGQGGVVGAGWRWAKSEKVEDIYNGVNSKENGTK